MTRKDYVLIAGVLASMAGYESSTGEAEAMRATIADRFILELERDNPRFNRGRFLAACKLPTGEPVAR